MKSLTIFFLLQCSLCWSQVELEIPPHPPLNEGFNIPLQAKEPSKENIILIDSLLKICNYETEFITTCENRIEQEGKVKNWDSKHIQWRKSKINYEGFKKNTVYDSFSGVTTEELKLLIDTFTLFNKNHTYMPFYPSNYIINNNLEVEIKGYLK